jgi:hypothetical protein
MGDEMDKKHQMAAVEDLAKEIGLMQRQVPDEKDVGARRTGDLRCGMGDGANAAGGC